jgi:hypothetical protein
VITAMSQLGHNRSLVRRTAGPSVSSIRALPERLAPAADVNSLGDLLTLLSPASLIAPGTAARGLPIERIVAAVRTAGPVGHSAGPGLS